jgi:hypothetical protein
VAFQAAVADIEVAILGMPLLQLGLFMAGVAVHLSLVVVMAARARAPSIAMIHREAVAIDVHIFPALAG